MQQVKTYACPKLYFHKKSPHPSTYVVCCHSTSIRLHKEFEQTKAKVTTAVAVHSLVATCACAIQRFLLLNIILFIVTFVFSPFHSQLTVFLLKVISVLFYLLIKMSSRSLQMCVLSLNICTHIHTHTCTCNFSYMCAYVICV